jgi:hypothetical protein
MSISAACRARAWSSVTSRPLPASQSHTITDGHGPLLGWSAVLHR